MTRNLAFLCLSCSLALLTGCVDRRFVINTDPPGAVVMVNGEERGATPADDHFVYYGRYHFTIFKDGYQTMQVDQEIPAPWYQYFPIDFFAENLWPWRITDVRRFDYHLEPLAQPRSDLLLNPAQNLRTKAASLPTTAAEASQ